MSQYKRKGFFAGGKPARKRGEGRGKAFEKEVLEAIHRENPYAFSQRIIDRFVQNKRSGRRYGGKTPADMIICADWSDLMIECKATLSTSLDLNALKPHQFRWLKKFNRVSPFHLGVVAVLFYNTETTKDKKIKRAFLIDIRTWARLRREYRRGDRKYKSINRNELFEGKIPAVELIWQPAVGWHVGEIVKCKGEGFRRRRVEG